MASKKTSAIRSVPTEQTIIYPESDGKPMAETDVHRDLMVDLIETLKHRFLDRPDAYVSGNLLLYYEQGNPRKSVAPDVFVVFGVEKKQRRTYLLWDEGKGPDLVIELVSKNTYRKDLTEKKALYAKTLGVREYYLYDPEGQYLRPSLRGYRLVDNAYEDIPPTSADGLLSETLNLELREVSGTLRLYDFSAKRWVLTPVEEAEDKAQQAEVELARLRSELERLRANQG